MAQELVGPAHPARPKREQPPAVPDPVAVLSPDDSIAPAGALNMGMAITDTERADLIQGPEYFRVWAATGSQARSRRGWELVGFCTGFPGSETHSAILSLHGS